MLSQVKSYPGLPTGGGKVLDYRQSGFGCDPYSEDSFPLGSLHKEAFAYGHGLALLRNLYFLVSPVLWRGPRRGISGEVQKTANNLGSKT